MDGNPEQAPGTGPCYGCGADVPDDPAHVVTIDGARALMCNHCFVENMAEIKGKAERSLREIETVARALRRLINREADKRDYEDLMMRLGDWDNTLTVVGEVDVVFLYGTVA